MIGRRIQMMNDDSLPTDLRPGDYGLSSSDESSDNNLLKRLVAVTPTGDVLRLDSTDYYILESTLGRITVAGIIEAETWSGWLVRGIWITKTPF